MATASRASATPCLFTVALFGATGCFAADDGKPPDTDRIYFPVGIALAPVDAPTRMYVANSDFDLQFNAGTLQSYDLDKLRALVPKYCSSAFPCAGGDVCDAATHLCGGKKDSNPCGALGTGVTLQTPAESLTVPGPCTAVDPSKLRIDAVVIGAFVTDVIYRDNPKVAGTGFGRLFLPVRGDATLHWIEVDNTVTERGHGALDCGQDAKGICNHDHRRGGDPAAENTRGVQLPAEPFGIDADEPGDIIVTTHQSSGDVSLFVNEWTAQDGYPVGPRLEFVAGGLPSGALAIAAIPRPKLIEVSPCTPYVPGFFLTFRNSAEIRRVRYYSDAPPCTGGDGGGAPPSTPASDPARPFLDATEFVPITANSLGFNSRGIAVDAEKRKRCEDQCPGSDSAVVAACLEDKHCAAVGLDVFVANRTPATLILGETRSNSSATGTDDLPHFFESVPLQSGPSRVIVGSVVDKHGARQRRIFVVCFDSRLIYVYDPDARRIETVIRTGRGPHALAIDAPHGLGYIGHFTDSYIGVVDLDQRHTETYGKILLTLGEPTVPRASK